MRNFEAGAAQQFDFEATCMKCSFHTYLSLTRHMALTLRASGMRCWTCGGLVILDEMDADVRVVT